MGGLEAINVFLERKRGHEILVTSWKRPHYPKNKTGAY
jgi:hypothetical protein